MVEMCGVPKYDPEVSTEHARSVCRGNGSSDECCTYVGADAKTKKFICLKAVPQIAAFIESQRKERGLSFTEQNYCSGPPEYKKIAN
jgi:hypothetical protein